jgi:hypothetical protein
MTRHIHTERFSKDRLELAERLILSLFSELTEYGGFKFSASISFIVCNINRQFIRNDSDNTDLNKKIKIVLDVCDNFSF